jgi:hypothetical protein
VRGELQELVDRVAATARRPGDPRGRRPHPAGLLRPPGRRRRDAGDGRRAHPLDPRPRVDAGDPAMDRGLRDRGRRGSAAHAGRPGRRDPHPPGAAGPARRADPWLPVAARRRAHRPRCRRPRARRGGGAGRRSRALLAERKEDAGDLARPLATAPTGALAQAVRTLTAAWGERTPVVLVALRPAGAGLPSPPTTVTAPAPRSSPAPRTCCSTALRGARPRRRRTGRIPADQPPSTAS